MSARLCVRAINCPAINCPRSTVPRLTVPRLYVWTPMTSLNDCSVCGQSVCVRDCQLDFAYAVHCECGNMSVCLSVCLSQFRLSNSVFHQQSITAVQDTFFMLSITRHVLECPQPCVKIAEDLFKKWQFHKRRGNCQGRI